MGAEDGVLRLLLLLMIGFFLVLWTGMTKIRSFHDSKDDDDDDDPEDPKKIVQPFALWTVVSGLCISQTDFFFFLSRRISRAMGG